MMNFAFVRTFTKMNRRKNMEMRNIWFRVGEFNKLVNAVEGNEKEKAFEILIEMFKRGDLE